MTKPDPKQFPLFLMPRQVPAHLELKVERATRSFGKYSDRHVTFIHIDYGKGEISYATTIAEKRAMLDNYYVATSILLASRPWTDHTKIYVVDQGEARYQFATNKPKRKTDEIPSLPVWEDPSDWGWNG